MSSCCSPSSGRSEPAGDPADADARGDTDGMVLLDGGPFLMGTDVTDGFPEDGEGPVRKVTVAPFWIDPLPITNERFARFVDATGFVSEAEREGWSFVFAGLLPDDFEDTAAVAAAQWWRQVFGASWRHPEGPHSDVADRSDHPVVHVSWNDAQAYCAWAEVRLPTEAEWEFSARGGLEQARYPWGDELTPGGRWMCNVWQGTFPVSNTRDDGYLGTAPAGSFPANGFGLHDLAGNTWDWVAGRFEPGGSTMVIRGGSYLCHDSYCNRYRVAARTFNTADSSTGNMGFRCARDA